MRRALIPLLLAACPALTACAGSGPAGARIEPLPEAGLRPCRPPSDYLPQPGAGDWELIAGRIGDELIRCGAEKSLLIDWANGVRKAMQ